jgi:hypothetical protein
MLFSQVHERERGLFWVDICDVANERIASWLRDGNGVPCVDGGHAGEMSVVLWNQGSSVRWPESTEVSRVLSVGCAQRSNVKGDVWCVVSGFVDRQG